MVSIPGGYIFRILENIILESSISGLVVEYIVVIEVTRVRIPVRSFILGRAVRRLEYRIINGEEARISHNQR